MPPSPVSIVLEEVRRGLALPVSDLWLACYALGSWLSGEDLRAVLLGDLDPTDREFGIISAALNEAAADASSDLRVPDRSDIGEGTEE